MNNILKYIAIISLLFLWNACEDYTEDYNVPPASIVGKFNYSSTTGYDVPDTIHFTNETLIPQEVDSEVTYLWDFGDSTTSNELNPSHVFASEGTFYVTLTPIIADTTRRVYDATEKIQLKKIIAVDTLFYEDFEGLNLIPDDWELVNVDGNTPDNPSYASMADSAWIVYESSFFESTVALGNSFYNPEAAADDWMILPKVTVGDNSFLSWEAMSLTTSGNYPDSYQIRVSTTTQDVAGCNANPVLYRVIDEAWGDDVGGEGIQERSVSLTRYANQEVYIAFRLNTPDPGGDRLAIDNIAIVNSKE